MSFEPNVLLDDTAEGSCTVLIADDDPMMVNTLVRAARRAGITPVTDTTSENVVKLAKLHRPQLIVLDVYQTIDGRDLLVALKADPNTRHIRVVMVSGGGDDVTRDDCIQLGAEDVFLKPLDPYFFRRATAR